MTERFIERGRSTPESEWLRCPALEAVPVIEAAELVAPESRAVIVAPHPDDETLATGGLLSQLVRLPRRIAIVAVSDGLASHPGSHLWPPSRLLVERPAEQARALRTLGLSGSLVRRLHLPDGQIATQATRLVQDLMELVQPGDVLFTTWRLDGHPDHEAVGNACAVAAFACGVALVEIPVWGWHWSHPKNTSMPWERARKLILDQCSLNAKCEALRMHRSQLISDASTGAQPVVDSAVLARVRRPFEVMFLHEQAR